MKMCIRLATFMKYLLIVCSSGLIWYVWLSLAPQVEMSITSEIPGKT